MRGDRQRLTIQICSDGSVYVVKSCAIYAEEYSPKCTAQELPPHGRLIDADAKQQETDGKLAELQKVIDDDSTCSEERMDAIADEYTMLTAKEWIAGATTIIEAEEEE